MAEKDKSQGHGFVYSKPTQQFNFSRDPQPKEPKKLTVEHIRGQLITLQKRLDKVLSLLEELESQPSERKRSHR